MATFKDARTALLNAASSSQGSKRWKGKRVRRLGDTFVVLDEDRERDTLKARNVSISQVRNWKRSEFLSRGLTILDNP